MLLGPCTSTGTKLRTNVDALPTPSLPPGRFAPHVHTVPSDLRTMVPLAPPQTDVTSAPDAKETSEEIKTATHARTLLVKLILRLLTGLTRPTPERDAPFACKHRVF